MGGAGVAAAEGAEAQLVNPALLELFDPVAPSEVALGYDALIESAYAGSAAWAKSLGAGAVGANLLYASQGAQTSYDAFGNPTGSFKPNDLSLGGAYAHRLGRASLGAGLKAIRSSLADRSATTMAADLGIVARHVTDLGQGALDLGASITNLGPPLKLGSIADPLPMRARFGASWRNTPRFRAAFDVVMPVDQDPYLSIGFEGRIPAAAAGSKKPWALSLRGGVDQSRSRGVDGFAGFSLGGGVDLSAMRVDYAWLAGGDLGSVSRLTLAVRF